MGRSLVADIEQRRRPPASPVVVYRMDEPRPAVVPHRWSYSAYISSDAWRRRRAQYFASHKRRCWLCRGKQHIELHHRTYERMGHELDEDLVALCRDCHAALHRFQRAKGVTVEAATAVVLAAQRHAPTERPKKAHPHSVAAKRRDDSAARERERTRVKGPTRTIKAPRRPKRRNVQAARLRAIHRFTEAVMESLGG